MIPIIGFGVFFYYYITSSNVLTREQTVVIPTGSSLEKITQILAENHIISFPHIFTIYGRLQDNAHQLKAGEYHFSPGITPKEVYHKIQSGEVVVHQLTIPEGWSVFQIKALIAAHPLLSGEITLAISEGTLLPETYQFHRNTSRDMLIQRMHHAMDDTLNQLWPNRAQNLPFTTKEEALILASIVEKETGLSEERSRVAAVFINRLRKNMLLQSDPTTIYALTQGKSSLDRPLYRRDLQIDSPFNTYKYQGLPPHPITNPGVASIKAVLHPIESDEYYFVADGRGGHRFAKTLKEHNENVLAWKRLKQ